MKNGYYDNDVFAKNLQRWMAQKGCTAKDAAAEIGVARSTFSDWMSGKKLPRMDKVNLLCTFFGCPPSALIGQSSTSVRIAPEDPDGLQELRRIWTGLSKADQHRLLTYAYELDEKNKNDAAPASTTSKDLSNNLSKI